MAIRGAGRGGIVPPAEHRFQPGWKGGPGRPSAGFTIREAINQFIFNGTSEQELRSIARGCTEKPSERIAAARILRAMETGDLADFMPVINGDKKLDELRKLGVNTEVVKKLKYTKDGPEIELFDRAGEAMDALIGHTELSVAETVKNDRIDENKPTELLASRVVVDFGD